LKLSKVVIHIGPHKTGSSFIQAMMRQNLDRFPSSMRVWSKSEPIFKAMVMACDQYMSGNHDAIDLIEEVASDIARNTTHDVLLMSNEDILGRLPSRHKYTSLYGDSNAYLRVIQTAFRGAGHDVHFVFYVRAYNDWLKSLYRYTFIEDPDREFAPKRYKARRNLPDDWVGICADLTDALGAEGITFVNYQKDRADGRLGTALYKICGMSDQQIDALEWIEPVNVSRPETVNKSNW
jgi:hypothetical protein